MPDKKITPKNLKSGQHADAIIEDYRSPTGAWYAEWDPQTEQAIPLSDEGGDYIPAKNFKTKK